MTCQQIRASVLNGYEAVTAVERHRRHFAVLGLLAPARGDERDLALVQNGDARVLAREVERFHERRARGVVAIARLLVRGPHVRDVLGPRAYPVEREVPRALAAVDLWREEAQKKSERRTIWRIRREGTERRISSVSSPRDTRQ